MRGTEQLANTDNGPHSLLPSMAILSAPLYAVLRTAPDLAWVMGQGKQRIAHFRADTFMGHMRAVTCRAFIFEAPARCDPPATRPLTKSLFSNGFILTWASLVAWVCRTGHECIGPTPAQKGGRL